MDDETVFERMKDSFRRILKRALIAYGNNYERMQDNAEVALYDVLNEISDQIYK